MIRGTGKWAGVPEADRKPNGPPTEFGYTYAVGQFAAVVKPSTAVISEDCKAGAATETPRGLSTLAPLGARGWGFRSP